MDAVLFMWIHDQLGSSDEMMHAFALSERSIAIASSSDQGRWDSLRIYICHVVFNICVEHSHKGLSQTGIVCGSEIVMSSEETVE